MKKFLFDSNNFDSEKKNNLDEPKFSEAQMALAKQQSFATGREEGLKDARTGQENQMASILASMEKKIDLLINQEEKREVEKNKDTIKLAMRVIHKILPQFVQQFALGEIERVLVESIETRRDEPRIAVTIPTQHLEALKTRIDEFAIAKGFAGKIILLADDAMSVSDCRVEWADGGAERLYERLSARIEGEFTRAITGIDTQLGPQEPHKPV